MPDERDVGYRRRLESDRETYQESDRRAGMARVPLRTGEDLPAEYEGLVADGDRHVFRALANAPAVLESFRLYSGRLWDVLPSREREILILATARALVHEYEWHQHVALARNAGVTDAEIRAISSGDLEAVDDRDAALVAYARAVALGDLRDADHDRLAEFYDDETVVGIAATVSHYVGIARTLDALDVELEEPFVGWTP